MQTFIGTKLINAIPMSRLDYNIYRNWTLPADENGADGGFLVEYLDGGTSNHPDHEGYISWSPTDVFMASYQDTRVGVTMGHAIQLMQNGMAVARQGWNGKGMFLYLVPENTYPARTKVAKDHIGESVPYGAYIAMKTAQGNVVPWLASQTDLLAEDWILLG